jgi:predicted nucleic acid-binding protein
MTALFDTNVLIDISDHREPFYEKSLEAFTLAVNGLINGLVSLRSIRKHGFPGKRWAL